MEIKWFFVIWGFVFTILIAGSVYFIALNISTQSFTQFQAQQNRSEQNMNQSIIIHDFLFDNITELKKDLDPILDQIPNATQSKLDQDRHYSQDSEEFAVIQNVSKLLQAYSNGTERVDREIEDHERLLIVDEKLDVMSQSLGSLLKALNNSGTIVEVPIPVTK